MKNVWATGAFLIRYASLLTTQCCGNIWNLVSHHSDWTWLVPLANPTTIAVILYSNFAMWSLWSMWIRSGPMNDYWLGTQRFKSIHTCTQRSHHSLYTRKQHEYFTPLFLPIWLRNCHAHYLSIWPELIRRCSPMAPFYLANVSCAPHISSVCILDCSGTVVAMLANYRSESSATDFPF